MRTMTKIIVVVFILVGLSVAVAAIYSPTLEQPIKTVRVAGEFRQVSKPKLQMAISHYVDQGFFEVNMDEVRGSALALPWVRDVTVRRVWPDSLHVAIVERVAIARWNVDGLLEADGSYFVPDDAHLFSHLPLLEGPSEMHGEVLDRFRTLAKSFSSFGGGINRMSMSARGSWEIALADGIEIRIGQDWTVEEVNDYARVLPNVLGTRMERVKRIDLRYTNGFAVEWKALAPNPSSLGQAQNSGTKG